MFNFGKRKQQFMKWEDFTAMDPDAQLKYIDSLGDDFTAFLRENFSDAEIKHAVRAANDDSRTGGSLVPDIRAFERELKRFEEMTGFPMPVKERTLGECEHGHRHPIIILDTEKMADLNGKLEAVMELGLDEIRKIVADTQQSADRAILSARRPPVRSDD